MSAMQQYRQTLLAIRLRSVDLAWPSRGERSRSRCPRRRTIGGTVWRTNRSIMTSSAEQRPTTFGQASTRRLNLISRFRDTCPKLYDYSNKV